jgi:hypothetical protein
VPILRKSADSIFAPLDKHSVIQQKLIFTCVSKQQKRNEILNKWHLKDHGEEIRILLKLV